MNTKLLFICIIIISVSKHVLAQQSYSIQKSFVRVFKYPQPLRDSCISTYTNLLFSVSSTGGILYIKISDSAPQQLRDEFMIKKPKLDLTGIKRLIKEKKLRKCGVVVPLLYIVHNDSCRISDDMLFENIRQLNYYGGKLYDGLSYQTEPFIVPLYGPVQ